MVRCEIFHQYKNVALQILYFFRVVFLVDNCLLRWRYSISVLLLHVT